MLEFFPFIFIFQNVSCVRGHCCNCTQWSCVALQCPIPAFCQTEVMLFSKMLSWECKFGWLCNFRPLQFVVQGVLLAPKMRQIQFMMRILHRIDKLFLIDQLIILRTIELVHFVSIINLIIDSLIEFTLNFRQKHSHAHFVKASFRHWFVRML